MFVRKGPTRSNATRTSPWHRWVPMSSLRAISAQSALGIAFIALLLYGSRTCGPFGVSWRLSYELWNAPCAPTVEARADLWITSRRNLIARAARRWAVDPRAIAGVIEYEALQDIHLSSFFGLTRSSGPGKVHYKALYFNEGMPASRQIEIRGMVPGVSMEQRKRILSTDRGAIEYIGAIMSALAAEAEKAGYHVRCSPATLATLYTGWSPDKAAALLSLRDPHRPLAANAPGQWVSNHLQHLTLLVSDNAVHCNLGGSLIYSPV